MDALALIGEQRIRAAIARGEFDDLPGKGEPLQLEDLSGVPDDLRLGYLLLRMTGHVTEELALRKECLQLRDLIAACTQADQGVNLRRRLNESVLRWRILIETRGGAPMDAEYAQQIEARFYEGI